MPRSVLLAVVLALAGFAQTHTVTDAEVARVHRSALIIDTHNDVTSATVKGFDIGSKGADTHTDIQRLRAGNVGAQFFAAYVGADYAKKNQSAHRALEMIDTIRHDIVDRYPSDFVLAFTADDILAAHKRGKIAALIGIEGGHAIEDSPRLLRDFYDLGVRYMTLTHTNTNGWADSSGDLNNPAVMRHGGLNDLGRSIVLEMNRLGMMVDISHVDDKTFWSALEVSKAPLIASHSSCRALSNVPRNMTDEMIAALAKKGGVVQINFECGFLNEATAKAETALEKKLGKYDGAAFKNAFASGEIPSATLADVVAHIDHAVKIGGIDSVGLGSDFDGIPCAPKGLDDVSKFPALTRALLEKGYSASDIHKIYGGNLLRVMRAVEKVKQTAMDQHP
jgi:membrane dipeptidase